MNATANSDIAIVGMAALFARAPDLAGYWYNILNRVDAIGTPPPEVRVPATGVRFLTSSAAYRRI